MEPVTRAHNTHSLLLETSGEPELVSKQAFLEEHGLDGLIRIESGDFALLPASGRYAHFNLERANHEPGKRYGLIRLVRHGYYDANTDSETLPVLSTSGIRFASCIAYKERISYRALTEQDFLHALPSCKDPAALTASILRRYRQSLPGLKDEELLDRGVAFTLLDLEPAR